MWKERRARKPTMNGEYWSYQHDEVWKNQRLRRFTGSRVIDPRSRRRLTTAANGGG